MVPPSPGAPRGISATSGASIRLGFSLPSTNPVRSRSWWYGQLVVSSATDARPSSSDERMLHRVEDHVVRTPGDPEHRVMLGGRNREAVDTGEGFGESFDVRRGIVRRDLAPEFRTEAGDEVHASDRGPRFAKGGDGPHGSGRVRPSLQIELQVGVRCGSEGEDPALRCTHAPDDA